MAGRQAGPGPSGVFCFGEFQNALGGGGLWRMALWVSGAVRVYFELADRRESGFWCQLGSTDRRRPLKYSLCAESVLPTFPVCYPNVPPMFRFSSRSAPRPCAASERCLFGGVHLEGGHIVV